MKMRIFSLTALVLLMLSVTAQALEPQATGGNPVLTFSGTTAQCSITCTGNKSTDQVEAKLTLYQGGAYVFMGWQWKVSCFCPWRMRC